MILEEGTDEQMKECAWRACLPRKGERWLSFVKSHTAGTELEVTTFKSFRVLSSGADDINLLCFQPYGLTRMIASDWLHQMAAGWLRRS